MTRTVPASVLQIVRKWVPDIFIGCARRLRQLALCPRQHYDGNTTLAGRALACRRSRDGAAAPLSAVCGPPCPPVLSPRVALRPEPSCARGDDRQNGPP